METTKETCKLFTIFSPDGSEIWGKHILGLIDNARKYANDWDDNDMTKILQNLEDASQTWEHLLYTMNGKLEILKCALYTLVCDFTNDWITFLQEKL